MSRKVSKKQVHGYGIRILNHKPGSPGWIQSAYGKRPARYADKAIAEQRRDAIMSASPHLKLQVQPI